MSTQRTMTIKLFQPNITVLHLPIAIRTLPSQLLQPHLNILKVFHPLGRFPVIDDLEDKLCAGEVGLLQLVLLEADVAVELAELELDDHQAGESAAEVALGGF